MFWTLAMILLLGSYVTSGFVPVVIFLALVGILTRLARERRRRLLTITAAARKPR
jgi:hypothetical protein